MTSLRWRAPFVGKSVKMCYHAVCIVADWHFYQDLIAQGSGQIFGSLTHLGYLVALPKHANNFSYCIHFMRAPQRNHLLNNGRDEVQRSWEKKDLIALMLQMALRKPCKTIKAIADLLHQSKVIYWHSFLPLILAPSQAHNRPPIWQRQILRQLCLI